MMAINKMGMVLGLVMLAMACSKSGDEADVEPQPLPQPAFTSRTFGDTTDVTTVTTGGTCLMGGSTDVDEAFKWMIARSGGGAFVVIRCDVSYGYNSYIYRMHGVNSVETILIATDADAHNAAIAARIRGAEALFIAGGDQRDYVTLWKDTPIEDAINYLIQTKHVPVGGTSAGCAIMGSSYFSALNGSVTSNQALRNPYSSRITLGHNDFIDNPLLQNTITDQHYSQREREGRLVTFMARMMTDLNKPVRAIAVDEETAVCIDNDGKAKVFGVNSGYFLQSNEMAPETCMADTLLTWNRNQQAVKVYCIAGLSAGNGVFDWDDENIAQGGVWMYYHVDNGVFYSH